MLVRLKWADIVTYHDKRVLSEVKEAQPAIIEIVGFLINEDKKVIRLAPMIFHIPEAEEVMPDDYTVIPKGDIIERQDYE